MASNLSRQIHMHTPPSSTPQSPHDERSFLFSPTAGSTPASSSGGVPTAGGGMGSLSTPASPTGGHLSSAAGNASTLSLSSIHSNMQGHMVAAATGHRTGTDTPSSSSSVTGGTDRETYTTSRAPSRTGSFSRYGMSGATIAKPDYSEYKLVVAMVGLPARGKSYLSNRLQRYLRWLEYEVKVFNVGQLRRAKAREQYKQTGIKADHTANFFDNHNQDAAKAREGLAEECLENLITWLKEGGNIGIHDATNSTMSRRKKLYERILKEPGIKIIFLESVCTDPKIIAENISVKVASGDPDYDGIDKETAEKDFRARIKTYEDNYQELGVTHQEAKLSYCKIIDVGKQVVVNRIDGYLESRVAFYLMNLHLTPRAIFLTRHGESEYNVSGKIGGDSNLSERGRKYAAALPKLIKDNIGDVPLTVWTSTLRRTVETAAGLPYPKLTWKSLDELDAGVCDGMTYEEIEAAYPEDYEARDNDKYNYRYQGGESYRDVVVRLEPVIMELERQENILLVCHQAVIRCLYAYLHGLSQDELPYIKIPLHTVIKLTPKAFGCEEQRYTLPIEAVDTFRPRPTAAQLKEPREEDYVSPSMMPPEVRRRLQEEAKRREAEEGGEGEGEGEDERDDTTAASSPALNSGGVKPPDVKVTSEGE